MKTLLTLCIALSLTACTGFGTQGLTAEQITAAGKNAGVTCVYIKGGLGYEMRSCSASLDAGVIRKGSVKANPDGTLEVTNDSNKTDAPAVVPVVVPAK